MGKAQFEIGDLSKKKKKDLRQKFSGQYLQ